MAVLNIERKSETNKKRLPLQGKAFRVNVSPDMKAT
jgi:hypothetical protein